MSATSASAILSASLPRSALLAYGALGLPLAMAALPVYYVHVPRLYPEAIGMSLSLLGALLLVARLLDAGTDPLLGPSSDRSRRRQRLIVFALPGLAIGMLALLHPPSTAAPRWLVASLLLILASWTLLATPAAAYRPPKRGSLFGDLGSVLGDGRFRHLLPVFVLNGIAAALPATLVLFFVADVLQAEAWSGAFLALHFASAVAFLPLWVRLARRFGWVGSWLLSMLAAVAWPFALVCLLFGAALGAALTMPAALLADMAEQSPEGLGERPCRAQAGAYFSWWSLVAKLNFAHAAGPALPLLDIVGYRQGVAEDTAWLVVVYCLLPLAFKGGAALLVWRSRESLETRR